MDVLASTAMAMLTRMRSPFADDDVVFATQPNPAR